MQRGKCGGRIPTRRGGNTNYFERTGEKNRRRLKTEKPQFKVADEIFLPAMMAVGKGLGNNLKWVRPDGVHEGTTLTAWR